MCSRCPCGAQFCYVCGLRWKTCSCAHADDARLLDRAAQIVARDPGRRLYQPQRIAHAQPVAPRPPKTSSTPLGWESDFSDHSEWESDWDDDYGDNSTTSSHITPRGPRSPRPSRLDARRIAETAKTPRANHACRHANWLFVRGSHTCEECHHHLPEFIFECRLCHLQACNRCKRNRL